MISGKNIILGLGTVSIEYSKEYLNKIDLIELSTPSKINQAVNTAKGVKKGTLTIPTTSIQDLIKNVECIINYLDEYAKNFNILKDKEKMLEIYNYVFDFTRADVNSVLAVQNWFIQLRNRILNNTKMQQTHKPVENINLVDILDMFKNLEHAQLSNTIQNKDISGISQNVNKVIPITIIEL